MLAGIVAAAAAFGIIALIVMAARLLPLAGTQLSALRQLFNDRRRFVSAVLVVFVVLLAWVSWMARYEVVAAQHGDSASVAYRLDRWTGAVEWCSLTQCAVLD